MIRHLSAILLALLVSACAGDLADVQQNTAPTLQSHGWFPIADGNHANIDCNKCHGAFDTFAGFDCLSCHPDAEITPRHSSNPDYQWTSAACYACHPTGEATSINHEPIFPIATGTAHAGISCGDCHLSSADRTQLRCAGCHESGPMTTAHAAVARYSFASLECILCHADSQVDRVASHLPFQIQAGTNHRPSRATCQGCHDARRTDKPFAAVDFSSSNCRSCHTRSHNRDTLCNSSRCHPDGTAEDDD